MSTLPLRHMTQLDDQHVSTAPQSASDHLRAAKDELVKQHVLMVAERVFAATSYSATKMQLIAREAGVSLATLYQFYPGKKDLYRSVLLARDRQMMAEVTNHAAVLTGTGLSIIPLLGLLRAQLSFLLQHPDYLKMILQEGHAWYHTAAQPTSDEQAMWQQGLQLMTAVFRHGMETEELVESDPADQARLLMALQQARLANWVLNGMQETHELVIHRIQADFVRQFCRPALARRLLDTTGSGLSKKTLKDIQAKA